jgi:NitT/TauT family transport system substrate-binding protein
LNGFTRRKFLRAAGIVAAAVPFGVKAQERIKALFAGGSTNYMWALPLVASKGGYYAARGVDMGEHDFPSGRDAMQAVLSNSAAFCAATDTPFVFSVLRGVAPKAELDFSRYSKDAVIVSLPGRGIVPDDPQSLKGKKIGAPMGTSGQYVVARYLKYAGLNPSDISLTHIAPADLVNTLIRGDIDAFSWTLTAANAAIRQSEGKAFVMKQDGFEKFYRAHCLLLTNDATITNGKELLLRTTNALLDAEKRIRDDPKWVDLIAQRVRTPADFILGATKDFDLTVRFDESLLDDLVLEAQWAIEEKLAPEPKADLRQLLRGAIHDQTLKSIAPDRVSLK